MELEHLPRVRTYKFNITEPKIPRLVFQRSGSCAPNLDIKRAQIRPNEEAIRASSTTTSTRFVPLGPYCCCSIHGTWHTFMPPFTGTTPIGSWLGLAKQERKRAFFHEISEIRLKRKGAEARLSTNLLVYVACAYFGDQPHLNYWVVFITPKLVSKGLLYPFVFRFGSVVVFIDVNNSGH